MMEAFHVVLPEIAALPDRQLLVLDIDVSASVRTVLAALPEIRALRPEIEGALLAFNLPRFDKLGDYALALEFAHRAYVRQGRRSMPARLANELAPVRDRLLAEAVRLANDGMVAPERLHVSPSLRSYRNVARSALKVVALLTEAWPAIEAKTSINLAELNRTGTMARELLAAIEQQRMRSTADHDAGEIRQRALTLFVEAYDDARRAVRYLLVQREDADEIAPPLAAKSAFYVFDRVGCTDNAYLAAPFIRASLAPKQFVAKHTHNQPLCTGMLSLRHEQHGRTS